MTIAASHGLTQWHGTTIIGVQARRQDRDRRRRPGFDGQHGDEAQRPQGAPASARASKVIAGFAGATADAFTLFERLEKKLEQYSGQLLRAAVELAKDWRTDKYLRNLEALMIVADKDMHAGADRQWRRARARRRHRRDRIGRQLRARRRPRARPITKTTPRRSRARRWQVAADVCVFTNDHVTVETV